MAQRLLKLEATFRDEDFPKDWQHNGCPFVVTKRKTRTEITFTSFGVPDNSLFSVEERTRLFSELEESLTGDSLHTHLPVGENN